MKKFALLAILMLGCFCSEGNCQDMLEKGWKVALYGGYSLVSGQATSNGFYTSAGIRVAQHWTARADVFTISSPASKVIVGGPEYRFSLKHLLAGSSFVDTQKLTAFVDLGAGEARLEGQGPHFAAKIGGGLDLEVSNAMNIRLFEANYIHSPVFPGGLSVGSNLQIATGVGIHF